MNINMLAAWLARVTKADGFMAWLRWPTATKYKAVPPSCAARVVVPYNFIVFNIVIEPHGYIA